MMISATISSVALLLFLIVGMRVGPLAIMAIRWVPPWTPRDVLMMSWGVLWVATTAFLALRCVRHVSGDLTWLQRSLFVDGLVTAIAIAAALMLLVDAHARRES